MAAAEVIDCMCSLIAGVFSKLHVLDLSDVFSTSQQTGRQSDGVLSDIVEGTSGNLKRLILDNAFVGEEAALAIAQSCTQLEWLSIPGCYGLTDRGLKSIALACKRLQGLCIGALFFR